MISLDTETTGLDVYHGAKPFFVTYCRPGEDPQFWEWDVDPLTREPQVPPEDLLGVKSLLNEDVLVLQNAKFDVAALRTLGVDNFPWEKVRDTLLAAHLLASNLPKDLTSLAMHYLAVDIEPLEKALQSACLQARNWARRNKPEWRIVEKGASDSPSAKEKTWKFDTWLPKTVVKEQWESGRAGKEYARTGKIRKGLQGWEYHPPWVDPDKAHPWWTVLQEYANADSAVTIALWGVMEKQIKARGLWAIYAERLKSLPVACDMERRGVTVSEANLISQYAEYQEQSQALADRCVAVAASCGYELSLPKSGSNGSLNEFCFGDGPSSLRLPTVKRTDTGNPSLDKDSLAVYVDTLPRRSKAYLFAKTLSLKRKGDTALAYMDGYVRFWLPLVENGEVVPGWYVLHPSLNPTGTATLRWSSSNPNEQNISKKKEFNLRRCFGPAPGREWWSLDAKNIELRIPAYECREEAFIALFERPDEPPYFGSNHLLISHILHPKEFESCRNKDGEVDGRIFKERYDDTLYQWVKNGNFAVQYGAIDKAGGLGTADRAYHMPGAQARIAARFKNQDRLNKHWIAYANKYGYVETLPDKTVDPRRGYPVMCSRTEYGGISPTVPLNYHIQSTAMWWMMKAMIRCHAKLADWRTPYFDGFIAMQVHDELVFDFPKSSSHPSGDAGREKAGRGLIRTSNLWRVRELQRLMALGGDDIGIPTPVSCKYHEFNWADGVSI